MRKTPTADNNRSHQLYYRICRICIETSPAPASCNWLWVNAFSSKWFIAWGTHIIWTSYLVRRVYVHGVQSSMEKYSCESLGTHTVSLYCHYILVRPFQIDLLFLGPPSQKFGVDRSTWKDIKKWISLKINYMPDTWLIKTAVATCA